MILRINGLRGSMLALSIVAIGSICALWAAAQAPYPNPGAAMPPPPANADPGSTGMGAVDLQGPSRWPMRLDTPDGRLTIYQPQLTHFDGDRLTGRAAVSIARPGAAEPLFGAIWMVSRVATDRAARTVQILDINVTRARFPNTNGVSDDALTAAMRAAIARQPMTLSLDQLLAMLQVIQQEQQAVKEISNDPPKIIFRDHPAVLVGYDGTPKLVALAGSKLMRVENSPFFIVLDPASKTYFLKGAGRWFAATDPMGPFQGTARVPAEVAATADNSGYNDPERPLSDAQAAGLEIVTTTEPTELICTDGPEEMGTLPGTNLLYVTNTDADVFVQIDTQQIFLLLSGRWFTASSRSGRWTYVAPDKLPADFQHIPPGGPKGDALAHVVGTQAAADAVADQFVPQTATIDRRNFDPPSVQYDGDPNFQPIENTALTYAVNSPNSVIQSNGRYYCCANAVWYVSGAPSGPWDLCTSVPSAIYTIPPSCPLYPVRYCYVYDSTPDWVYCGYTPGYVGCFPYDHVVVYGTGYHYHPWIGQFYYPGPWTFGFAAHYNVYGEHWGFNFGLAWGGGQAWFGNVGAVALAPSTAWFGRGGFRPVHFSDERGFVSRNNISVVNRSEVQRSVLNLYQRRRDVRGATVVRSDAALRDERTAISPRTLRDDNNVLTDRNGNVYRKSLDGWEQRSDGKWVASHNDNRAGAPRDNPSGPSAVTPRGVPVHPDVPRADSRSDADSDRSELNRDYRARVAGDDRSRNIAPSGGDSRGSSGARSSDNSRGGDSRGSSDPRSDDNSRGGSNSRGGNGAGSNNGNGSPHP